MKTWQARVRTTYREIWTVEAETEEDAKVLLMSADTRVDFDESGGEMVDFDVGVITEDKAKFTT